MTISADELAPQQGADAAEGRSRSRVPRRVLWLKNILAASMLAGMLLSPRLWLSSRTYPLFPVSDLLPAIPYPIDVMVYGVLVFLLFYIIVQPRPRLAVLGFAFLAGTVALADQSRWQPWFYQYLFMLLPLGLYPWCARAQLAEDQAAAEQCVLNPCRLIVAGTYFYSGLQKFNTGFWDDTGPWLLQPILQSLPPSFEMPLRAGLLVTPVIETLIGIGLLLNVIRPFAVLAAIVMHLLILWSIGPLGLRWNSIVWPWNLAMIVLTPLLFLKTGPMSWKSILFGERGSIYPRIVLLLFGIMPIFSFAGYWDLYLSASLYSGRSPEVTYEFGEGVYRKLPEGIRRQCYVDKSGYVLSLMMWSLNEMNVPDYAADRIYRGVGRYLAQWTDGSPNDDVVLRIRQLPRLDGVPRDEQVIYITSGGAMQQARPLLPGR